MATYYGKKSDVSIFIDNLIIYIENTVVHFLTWLGLVEAVPKPPPPLEPEVPKQEEPPAVPISAVTSVTDSIPMWVPYYIPTSSYGLTGCIPFDSKKAIPREEIGKKYETESTGPR